MNLTKPQKPDGTGSALSDKLYEEIEMTDKEKLNIALAMLAEWCVAVDENGTTWDDWDEHYKDAMYRPGPIRAELDAAIAEARKQLQ